VALGTDFQHPWMLKGRVVDLVRLGEFVRYTSSHFLYDLQRMYEAGSSQGRTDLPCRRGAGNESLISFGKGAGGYALDKR
jgi:hypothetical protein